MSIKEQSYQGVNFCLRCGNKLQFIRDSEDKLRKKCEHCGWTYYKNPIPAVACVVFNEAGEILIIKRLIEPKAGEWALPSGYIEIDQSPEQAALDELLEETGLEGRIKKFLGYYDGTSPFYEKVLSLGFLMKKTGGKLEAGDDAGEAKFVSLDKLPKLAFLAHEQFVKVAQAEVFK
ncbi:MAG: NUDIX hydrolase [Candidatus Cloacimonetes bacterium]|nr:NUDIX hydrolase [Candidatus Cloacimonadota bacterium]